MTTKSARSQRESERVQRPDLLNRLLIGEQSLATKGIRWRSAGRRSSGLRPLRLAKLSKTSAPAAGAFGCSNVQKPTTDYQLSDGRNNLAEKIAERGIRVRIRSYHGVYPPTMWPGSPKGMLSGHTRYSSLTSNSGMRAPSYPKLGVYQTL